MKFALRFLIKGQRFTIYALEEGSEAQPTCEVIDFIRELNEKDRNGIIGRLNRDAEYGPPRNEEQSKEVGGGIFELKFKSLRLLWFYDMGKIIVCSHGFFKGKSPKKVQNGEITRARERKEAYESSKVYGQFIKRRGEP